MARCPGCGGEAFRVEDAVVEADAVLACASCGRAVGAACGALIEPLAELAREVRQLREEVVRLRQAVNFLNQRVR